MVRKGARDAQASETGLMDWWVPGLMDVKSASNRSAFEWISSDPPQRRGGRKGMRTAEYTKYAEELNSRNVNGGETLSDGF